MSLEELPGAEFVLPGLEDLHRGKTHTINALLVMMATQRLTEAGLHIPRENRVAEPELALYGLLQEQREDAYGYYNALVDQLISFCSALELRNRYQLSNPSPVS